MKVSGFSGGKLTVFLSREDISNIGIPIEKMASSEPKIRLIMTALYRVASEKAGLISMPSSLFIIALPTETGGILHFSPNNESFPRIKARPRRLLYLYEFSDGSAFLDAIEFLYSKIETRRLESSVFEENGLFYLEILPTEPKETLLAVKEFSDNFYILSKKDRKPQKWLAEKNAILKIGSAITKP